MCDFLSTKLVHTRQFVADQNPSKCHAGEVKDQDPPFWLIGNPVPNQLHVKHVKIYYYNTIFFTSMFPKPLRLQAASRPHHLLPPSTNPDQTSDVSV